MTGTHTSPSSSTPSYDPVYFPALLEVEERHFWFVGRRECILDALRRCVPDLSQRGLFDIGCGTGGLIAYLARNGVRVVGACDAYVEALQIARGRIDVPLSLVKDDQFAVAAAGHDLVSLFDVLEHLHDDEETLRDLAGAIPPGGLLVLTVPAHPFLFDEADILAGHRRRYGSQELRAKLEQAGFEVRLLTHFMAPLVPGMIVARVLGKLLQPLLGDAARRRNRELRIVPVLNGVIRALLRLERAWLRIGSLPFGTSLLVVGRRRAAVL